MANKVQVHTTSFANWALRREASSGGGKDKTGGGGKSSESAWNAASVLAARGKRGGDTKGSKT
jgi:hypothetical protein